MQVNREIRRRLRRHGRGASVVADVNVAIAGSIAEPGRTTRTSVHSHRTVVQRRASATAEQSNAKEARK